MARDGQGEYDGEEVLKVDNSLPRSDVKDIPCLLDGLLGKEVLINEGLQDFLLPPNLKNTIALSLVS